MADAGGVPAKCDYCMKPMGSSPRTYSLANYPFLTQLVKIQESNLYGVSTRAILFMFSNTLCIGRVDYQKVKLSRLSLWAAADGQPWHLGSETETSLFLSTAKLGSRLRVKSQPPAWDVSSSMRNRDRSSHEFRQWD